MRRSAHSPARTSPTRTITDPDTGRVYPVPSGGADDTPGEGEGRLAELAGRIDSEHEPLTDDELAELEALAVEAFDEADNEADPDLDAMEELHAVIARTRQVAAEREAEADERRQRAAELRQGIHVADEPAEGEEPTGEANGDEPTATTDDEVDASGVPDDASGITEAEREPAAAVASAPARPTLAAANRRRRANTQPAPRRSNLTVVTAGDVPGRSAGSPLNSLREVGDAFAAKADAVRKHGAMRGQRFGVASFQVEYPEDRRLGTNGQVNDERIEAVVAGAQAQSIDAIVAAGGLCAPVDVAYDLEGISVETRPIRDSLPRFGADRGGIRFIEPPTLADLSNSVGVWTELNDQDPGANDNEHGPDTKAVQVVTCGNEVEVLINAVTRRLQVGNFSRRTFPEQFSRFWQLSGAAHSRLAENTLWDAMVGASTAVTFAQQLGAARDILTVVDTAVAAYRSRHRMSDTAVLRMVAPSWVLNLMRTDVAKQLPGDASISRTDAEIREYFSDRGVAVTFSPDAGQEFGAQSAGALDTFPSTVELLLHHEGAFTFLDGGVLDFGMEIRDSTLNATNDVEAFMETFENVAFRGIESLHITATVTASGETAGLEVASAT